MTLSVIKIGGGEGIDPCEALREVGELVRSGQRVVVVHGGSHETNEVAKTLGRPHRFMTSPSGHVSRRTDRDTLDVFAMVYCGKINTRVVESLRRDGVDAIGLSGVDGGLWIGKRRTAIRSVEEGRTVIIRDDLSGAIQSVDSGLLELLLSAGRVPVLCPPAVTEEGVAINVDADRAAAATAAALGADELLLLSNVPGVLADPNAGVSTLIASVEEAGLDVVRAAASGRMKNKVLAAEEALAGGVDRVVIASARGERPIDAARSGRGTVFGGSLAERSA